MKKKLIGAAAALACAANVFAFSFADLYNPPFGGQDIFSLSNPALLSGGDSATGGPAFTVLPASIVYNPALPAVEQRVVLNLSYSALFDTNRALDTDPIMGNVFQTGIIVPSRYMVFSGSVQGTFVNFPRMDLGNSINIHAGVAKDVYDNIFVGANIYSGFYFGSGSDFTLGMDLGLLYEMEDISFLKNPRLGFALLNIGKPQTGNYYVNGINGNNKNVYFPGVVTPRASFAATLLDAQGFKCGFSGDVYLPTLQNIGLSMGLDFAYQEFIQVCLGWNFDLREAIKGGAQGICLPTIGVNCRFTINSKKITFGHEDWERSEIAASGAWKSMYDGINVVSGGATLYLGMKDTAAPEIYLWDEIPVGFEDGEELEADSVFGESAAEEPVDVFAEK